MKFGKLDSPEGVDFTLPTDHMITSQFKQKPVDTPSIYAGGTMWGIKDWKGTYFPEKTKIADFGAAYAKQFGTIELNATHYRIHPPTTIAKWREMTPEGFKFCPKWPQLITHYRRFNNSDGLTDEFLEAIMHFGDRLGTCFIQLPPNYTPKHEQKLLDYLATLPADIELAVEVRHADWFSEPVQLWPFLLEKGIGAVISDTAGRRDAVHMALTAPHVIMRFGGYELHKTDEQRLSDWVDRLNDWKQQGMKSFHLLVHQPNSILTPETCQLFADLVGKKMGLSVKAPKLIEKPSSLF